MIGSLLVSILDILSGDPHESRHHTTQNSRTKR